jgi:hypothetical protein
MVHFGNRLISELQENMIPKVTSRRQGGRGGKSAWARAMRAKLLCGHELGGFPQVLRLSAVFRE